MSDIFVTEVAEVPIFRRSEINVKGSFFYYGIKMEKIAENIHVSQDYPWHTCSISRG